MNDPPKASDGVAYGSGFIDDFGRCTETNATQPKASSEEPFRSFRMLDAKLTLLANQQDALKAAFNPVQSGSGSEAANSAASDGGFQKYELHSRWNCANSGPGWNVCTKGAISASASKCLELCASKRRKFNGMSMLWLKRKREAR